MRIAKKIVILIYTLLVVFCLTRLAQLEPNKLAQILEIMLAAATIVKTLQSISLGSPPEDCDTEAD